MTRKFEFNEESASQWYNRLNESDKAIHRELMNDLINSPHQYIDGFTKNEYEKRVETLNATVPAESLYTLDNYVARTFYDANPSIEMLAPVTTVKASKSHRSKTYAGTDFGTARAIGAGGSFKNPPMIGMTVSPTFINALGIHAGYELSFSEIDEAGLYDIEWYFALKCGEKVGTLHDQRLCLGEAGEDMQVDAGGVKGVFNYGTTTTAQEAFWGIGDNTITTSGDLRRGLIQNLTMLKSVKEPGDVILLTTSGVHSESLILKDALGISDFVNIRNDLFVPGHIKEWWINDNIDATATMTITTQEACLFKRGMNMCKREIVYPLQSKLMLTKEFPDDVKTMIMIMDIYKMYNIKGLVLPDDAVTATLTTSTLGFAQNGRIL
ncbi:hypothetical protein LCGC14_0708690 [marine sediment metagenome]|uniref:Uncharacterized protein n=1 Tax=marine sediment metagenome TaxID=412755 RepID=A0A0F9QFQ3_9ZZZZ